MTDMAVAHVGDKPLSSKDWRYKKLYEAWKNMIRRCYDPLNRSFKNYGARGIAVCDEWQGSFRKFVQDVGHPPEKWSSLDRYPDNNAGYKKDNIRWATQAQQMRNRRNTLLIPWEGEMLPAVDVAARIGADPLPFARYIWQRIYRQSFTPAEAIEEYGEDGRTGDRRRSNSTLLRIKDGPIISLQEAAAEQGLDYDNMNCRYYRGASLAEALGLDDNAVTIIQEVRRPRKAINMDKVRRVSTLVSIDGGDPVTVPEACAISGVPYRTALARYRERGLPIAYALGLEDHNVVVVQDAVGVKRDIREPALPSGPEAIQPPSAKQLDVRTGSLDQHRLDI